MEIITKTTETVTVRLSVDELNTLVKVLNKVCNTLHEKDLKVRMGVYKEEVLELSSSIIKVIEYLDSID